MGGLFKITLCLKKRKTWKLMHRGVRWSILGVIFEARETHKSQKKQLLLTLFFSVVFWCRKGGGRAEQRMVVTGVWSLKRSYFSDKRSYSVSPFLCIL